MCLLGPIDIFAKYEPIPRYFLFEFVVKGRMVKYSLLNFIFFLCLPWST